LYNYGDVAVVMMLLGLRGSSKA